MGEGGQPRRHHAYDADALGGQVEEEHEQTTKNDARQGSRDFRRQALQRDQHAKQRQAEGKRGPVRLAQPRGTLPELAQALARLELEAEELAELPADDAEPDAVQEAGENGPRQKIGDEPKTGDSSEH